MSSAETHVLWAKSTAQLGIRGPDPHYVLKTEDKEWRKEYENDFERTEFDARTTRKADAKFGAVLSKGPPGTPQPHGRSARPRS